MSLSITSVSSSLESLHASPVALDNEVFRTVISAGTRKCGSPEPPPPPPRNANTDNNCSSSFNESKDSNEISEAECDQPRNYPGKNDKRLTMAVRDRIDWEWPYTFDRDLILPIITRIDRNWCRFCCTHETNMTGLKLYRCLFLF